MSYHRKLIDLTLLNINIENPRFEMVGNQLEAIKTMIEDQDNKLVNLADDITKEGLNPGDPIFVSKHEKLEVDYVNGINALEFFSYK